MASKLVIFLGQALVDPQGGYQRRVYDFGDSPSAPMALFGVALFRWLCGSNRVPDELLIIGTPHSSWDALHELAALPPDYTDFAQIGLHLAVSSESGVDDEQLDELELLLNDFLTGVSVHCALVGETNTRVTLDLLREFCDYNDRIFFELPAQRSHVAALAAEVAAFVRQVFEMRIGGMYSVRDMPGEVVEVVRIETSNILADWSLALANFRRTGHLGSVVELFRRHDAELTDLLEQLAFAMLTSRVDDVDALVTTITTRLEALSDERSRSAEAMVFKDMARELHMFLRAEHPSSWQLELARRALGSSDYLRAAKLCAEAVLTATISDELDRGVPAHRRAAEEKLYDPSFVDEVFPIDLQTFYHLRLFQRAMSEGLPTDEPTVLLALRSSRHMRHFLERALAFSAVVVEHLKRRQSQPSGLPR